MLSIWSVLFTLHSYIIPLYPLFCHFPLIGLACLLVTSYGCEQESALHGDFSKERL